MLGKCVLDVKVLKNALHILGNEIEPNDTPGAASVKFRKNCVLSLFYKVSNNIRYFKIIVYILKPYKLNYTLIRILPILYTSLYWDKQYLP